MLLNLIKIKNFRALKDVEIPLSNFVCIIGQNNSGKSSVLLALNLFLGEGSINKHDFHDRKKSIEIEVEITGIDNEDLNRLEEKHRKKLTPEIKEGKLKLVREFKTNKTNKLFIKKFLPKDNRFSEKTIENVLKGKTGAKVKSAIQHLFPEYSDHFDDVTSQKKAKEKIVAIIENMDITEKIETKADLPSGIPSSITSLLPKPIFISAVKDLTDESKTKSSSTFGKIITALMDIIDDSEIEEITNSLNHLEKLVNRIEKDDGNLDDDRVAPLKKFELMASDYLGENFDNTKIEIDIVPPSLNTIFSSAEIVVDDGFRGNIDSKGDGLKRAVIFALLRTYNELNELSKKHRPYIFLFEEPELYLHPNSQKILFEALCKIARDNQVLTSTHSPLFFSNENSHTFVKMQRACDDSENSVSMAFSINFKDKMDGLDIAKIISFENNNAAFFADKVLFVEGDSDLYFFKNISKNLNKEWDFDLRNIPIIRIAGKGNVSKYKEFFETFKIEVHMILDLDILVKDFDKLEVSPEIKNMHSNLKTEIQEIIDKEGITGFPKNREEVKEISGKYTLLEKYEELKKITNTISSSNFLDKNQAALFEEFGSAIFKFEGLKAEKEVLTSNKFELTNKNVLIDSLRNLDIYVLSKGTIEDYYPDGVFGRNKPLKALNACKILENREKILEVCPVEDGGKNEFEIIFENIFES